MNALENIDKKSTWAHDTGTWISQKAHAAVQYCQHRFGDTPPVIDDLFTKEFQQTVESKRDAINTSFAQLQAALDASRVKAPPVVIIENHYELKSDIEDNDTLSVSSEETTTNSDTSYMAITKATRIDNPPLSMLEVATQPDKFSLSEAKKKFGIISPEIDSLHTLILEKLKMDNTTDEDDTSKKDDTPSSRYTEHLVLSQTSNKDNHDHTPPVEVSLNGKCLWNLQDARTFYELQLAYHKVSVMLASPESTKMADYQTAVTTLQEAYAAFTKVASDTDTSTQQRALAVRIALTENAENLTVEVQGLDEGAHREHNNTTVNVMIKALYESRKLKAQEIKEVDTKAVNSIIDMKPEAKETAAAEPSMPLRARVVRSWMNFYRPKPNIKTAKTLTASDYDTRPSAPVMDIKNETPVAKAEPVPSAPPFPLEVEETLQPAIPAILAT